MAKQQLVSVKNAAKRIDASPMTVYRLIYAGTLTPHYIGTGKVKPRVRLDEAEVDAYIAGTAA